MIYNARTPDLYPHNAHHKLGWILTWMVCAQIGLQRLGTFFARSSGKTRQQHAPYMPVDGDASAEQHRLQRLPTDEYRYSNDSDEATQIGSPPSPHGSLATLADAADLTSGEQRQWQNEQDDLSNWDYRSRKHWISKGALIRALTRISPILCVVVDRVILILGFVGAMTGIVAYTGVFVSVEFLLLMNPVC